MSEKPTPFKIYFYYKVVIKIFYIFLNILNKSFYKTGNSVCIFIIYYKARSYLKPAIVSTKHTDR